MELVLNNIELEIIKDLEANQLNEPVKRLYDLYFKDITSFIKSKGGNDEDGADIFQEAVILLIEKIKSKQFRKESSLKTFLVGIVKNLWLSEQRSRGRRKLREEYYISESDEIEQPEIWRKQQKEITQLFEQLDDVCKNILIGFYFENKNMKSLLKEFNFKNEQVLRNRKALCMKKLKELLTNHLDFKTLLNESKYE